MIRGSLTFLERALNYRGGILSMPDCGRARAGMSLHRAGGDWTMTANVTVSPSAARRIGEILEKESAGAMLRVSVEGGGCSGFQYKFDIERSKADDDMLIRREGAAVLIDSVSVSYLAGSEIDFVDDLIGASFRINNPQATASCGCGTSFSI